MILAICLWFVATTERRASLFWWCAAEDMVFMKKRGRDEERLQFVEDEEVMSLRPL